MIDSFGVYGNYFHYAMVVAMVGSAGIIFIYLWFKGRLNMDEESKYQMMKEDGDDTE